VDEQCVGAGAVERLHAARGLPVRQCQHHRVGTQLRQLVVARGAVAQPAGVCRVVVCDPLAVECPRGHEREFESGVPCEEPDQLRAHMAARADDADAELARAHVPAPFAPRAASRASRWRRTAGHSASMMEYSTVSRRLPSAWRMWLRITPSCFAPRRSIAAREAWLNQLVLKPTATQPSSSNAWPSSSRLASVLSPVRCTRRPYQV